MVTLCCVVAMGLAVALAGAASGATAIEADRVPEGFKVAMGGDMIGPFHAFAEADDQGFSRVAALFRGADLGFANQEGSIFDLATFAGYPAAETGGGFPLQAPEIATTLRRMGLTIVSKANNHATDFGAEGLLATLRTLKNAGLAQAGAGGSEDEARGASYVDTPKGRAALVDAASTFTPLSAAGPAITRHGVATNPRPGISVLHVREVRLVPTAEVDRLRRLVDDTYSKVGEARIGDQIFRGSPDAGWLWEMDPGDEAAILSSISQARTSARFVLFSIHPHETAGHNDERTPPGEFESMVIHRANEAPSPLDPRPAQFETLLFHAAIDAGADAVVRTGPHVLDGVEIYRGKPIFYGLGGLFFDRDGRRGHEIAGGFIAFPPEQFEGVVPVTVCEGGKTAVVRLYPTVICDSDPLLRGLPELAQGEHGQRILRRLQTMSAQFGTRIQIVDGVGEIRIP